MDKNLINIHYTNFDNAVRDRNIDAIDKANLFIKSVICEAYNVNETDYNTNAELIWANIADAQLCEDIQQIRKIRNKYQHNSNESININYEKLQQTVNRFIKYINTHTSFRWKYVNDRLYFEADQDAKSTNKITRKCLSTISREKNIRYPIAYGDSKKSFIIKNTLGYKNEHPIFSIIHNMISRGNNIPESKYLIDKKLSLKELREVYIYEILILRFLCGQPNSYSTIHFPSKDETVVKLAVEDIVNYVKLLSQICSETEASINLVADESVTKYTISDGQEYKIAAKIINEITYESPVLISNHVNYWIGNSNADIYNYLVEDLFTIPNLKEGQIEALNSVFGNNNDSLIILPTGYGKSLIYQLFAILEPQISIIISPTQFLIDDQLYNLKKISFTSPFSYNSKIGIQKNRGDNFIYYSTLIYAIPDEIESEDMFHIINSLYETETINMITIDECHQISVWGHKFTASYFTLLHQLLLDVPNVRLLLFSATASRRITEDIINQLAHKNIQIIRPCSLERKNIEFEIVQKESFDSICSSIVSTYTDAIGTNNVFDVSNDENPNLSLILCNNYSILNKIASHLFESNIGDYCEIFNGQILTLNNFRNATTRILLTDDECLAGINIALLKSIIIVGYPPSKEWLYQESGRVGRAGESSKVKLYVTKESTSSIENIIYNKNFSINLLDAIIELSKKHKDCANLEFLHSMHFDNICIEEALNSLTDIENKIFIKDESSIYGTVIGKAFKKQKELFDLSMFLLFNIGIVKKWLLLQEGDFFEYRLYINRRIEDGYNYFVGKLKREINTNSVKNEIINKYNNIIETPEGIISTEANWLSENGYYIRIRMFIHSYELIQNRLTDGTYDVEHSLVSYFNAGFNSLEEFFPRYNKNNINTKITFHAHYEQPIKKEIRETKKEIRETKKEKKLLLSKTDELINFCIKSSTVVENDIKLMHAMLLLDKNELMDDISTIIATLEREQEYHENQRISIALMLIELLYAEHNSVSKTKDAIINCDYKICIFALQIIQSNISEIKKRDIDRILINNSLKPIYYNDYTKEGCYIATCVYGSYNCPEVWILRRYRDQFLRKRLWGKIFIRLYYAISPYIVNKIKANKKIISISKALLDCKIKRLLKLQYSMDPYDDRVNEFKESIHFNTDEERMH